MQQNTEIRVGGNDDLPAVFDLLTRSLAFDRFSPALLAEKLAGDRYAEGTHARFWVAESDGHCVGMMQDLIRPAEQRAWLGLFAVEGDWQRRGVASRLLACIRSGWEQAGVREAEALAVPGNYFTPGIDPRYTAGLCFLERRGFERFRDCVNLLTDLRQPFDTTEDETRLAERGVVVRRAKPADRDLLAAFFAEDFGQIWLFEAMLALGVDPPALHLALQDGRIIAFSAHSTQNREWGFFGPMGTLPAARGLGMGRVLLLRCLRDMRDAGHATSVIPWVGPISFYSHHVAAKVDRVFWRYRLTLAE